MEIYDVRVIGSGPAGGVLSKELAEAGAKKATDHSYIPRFNRDDKKRHYAGGFRFQDASFMFPHHATACEVSDAALNNRYVTCIPPCCGWMASRECLPGRKTW